MRAIETELQGGQMPALIGSADPFKEGPKRGCVPPQAHPWAGPAAHSIG